MKRPRGKGRSEGAAGQGPIGDGARLPNGVEGEEVGLVDAARVAEVLEARAQHPAERVLEGDAEEEHGAAVVAVEVDALGHLRMPHAMHMPYT